jgi:hypothetical protein
MLKCVSNLCGRGELRDIECGFFPTDVRKVAYHTDILRMLGERPVSNIVRSLDKF